MLCPRKCGVSRTGDAGNGFCLQGDTPRAARAALHFWEEPPVSGTRGAGAIFFSGCTLRCIYCQNHQISTEGFGVSLSPVALRRAIDRLTAAGAHNIELVTATHFLPAVLRALTPPPPVPVVFNCGGYERVSTLRALEGRVQIYLPDMKYGPGPLGARYSSAPDYFEVSSRAILEMYRQVGDCVFDEDGLLKKGMIVRHLILPGHLKNTFAVLDFFAEHFKDKGVFLSLMSQYTPPEGLSLPPPLNRRLTERERALALRYMEELGITRGWTQEPNSADERFLPLFDLSGLTESGED